MGQRFFCSKSRDHGEPPKIFWQKNPITEIRDHEITKNTKPPICLASGGGGRGRRGVRGGRGGRGKWEKGKRGEGTKGTKGKRDKKSAKITANNCAKKR